MIKERSLASIQRILSLEPIPGADNIVKATVLGWQCVVKKNEYNVGDLCIFCEVDSILPERPEFEFLRAKGFRIKTVKLKKQVSQGICFPLSILPEVIASEGLDVTELLGVKKWELEVPAQLRGLIKGNFPGFLRKTDETRIQAAPQILERYKGQTFCVTEKLDGSSMTVYRKDGVFGVCSRNLDLTESEGNAYWKTARQLKLEERLASLPGNWCLQGELIGPGVQKNKYELSKDSFLGSDLGFFVFNIYNIDTLSFVGLQEFNRMLDKLSLWSVPILNHSLVLNHSVEELVEYSKGYSKLNGKVLREGVVLRPWNEMNDEDLGRLSFKIINPDFLLKHDE